MTVAVYFDLDGTLVEFDRPFEAILQTTFEESFGRVEDEWLDVYGEYFWSAFQGFDPDPYRSAVADLCELGGMDADTEAVADRLIENELAASTVDPAARETVARLAADADHRVGVLTNGVSDVQRAKIRRNDLDEYVDAALVSYEVGVHKPDPAIFERARERIDADRYVMVGDDYEGDVAPAEDQGFVGVHVDDDLDPTLRARSVGAVGEIDQLL